MLVRYLPVILVLATLVLVLAPLETAGQSSSGPNASDKGQARAEGARKADKPRPRTAGAPGEDLKMDSTVVHGRHICANEEIRAGLR